MAVSGADKAFRDRQAMIGEFSPIPLGYAFLCRPWKKNGSPSHFDGFCRPDVAQCTNSRVASATMGPAQWFPLRPPGDAGRRLAALGDNAGMTRGEPSSML
ncbi:hypothetical protein PPN31119_02037 [Pandoraea pnomenusa]|jgi:hypothetical protein|uniref:Uncharacterized protein n=1 Tax=Pandoraea pnomenusa TaxID=93220 RepID=A0ABY6WIT0_9BURK|nr:MULTISPECIES: hypothetical protein [Pandoraea]ANC44350.1 hypothetical protein A6P55_09180 [Pandoraea pnomenusa]VVE65837.1 hypothetical protein PPN31119_02037 [Pandoraea pnomenusa]